MEVERTRKEDTRKAAAAVEAAAVGDDVFMSSGVFARYFGRVKEVLEDDRGRMYRCVFEGTFECFVSPAQIGGVFPGRHGEEGAAP